MEKKEIELTMLPRTSAAGPSNVSDPETDGGSWPVLSDVPGPAGLPAWNPQFIRQQKHATRISSPSQVLPIAGPQQRPPHAYQQEVSAAFSHAMPSTSCLQGASLPECSVLSLRHPSTPRESPRMVQQRSGQYSSQAVAGIHHQSMHAEPAPFLSKVLPAGGQRTDGGQSSGKGKAPPRAMATTPGQQRSSTPHAGSAGQQRVGVATLREKSKGKWKKDTKPQLLEQPLDGLVWVNHFTVKVTQGTVYHQYSVRIERVLENNSSSKRKDKPLNRNVCRKIKDKLIQGNREDFGQIVSAYDGSRTLFTTQCLPFTSKDFFVEITDDFDKQQKFTVSVENVAIHPGGNLNRTLAEGNFAHALDVATRECMCNHYIEVGRSFFDGNQKQELGFGIDAWTGFFQSLRPTEQGLALNLNITNTTFFKEGTKVADYIKKMMQGKDPPYTGHYAFQYQQLECQLRGVKVKVWDSYTKEKEDAFLKKGKREGGARERWTKEEKRQGGGWRRYRINSLAKSAEEEIFTYNGRDISVKDYFAEVNKIDLKLKYSHYPCVRVQSLALFPSELCHIMEQRVNKIISLEKERDKAACLNPSKRLERIQGLMNKLPPHRPGSCSVGFGMKVTEKMTQLKAKMLSQPSLNCNIVPENGKWNLGKVKVAEGSSIKRWLLINFNSEAVFSNHQAAIFISALSRRCSQLGFHLESQTALPPSSTRLGEAILNDHKELEEKLKSLQSQANYGSLNGVKLRLLVCIFPSKSFGYGYLKYICEHKLGLLSQCCFTERVADYNYCGRRNVFDQYLGNLALKINAKAGGVTTLLETPLSKLFPSLSKGFVLLGADVSHSSGELDPAIAAVVCSIDTHTAAKYATRIKSQERRQEIISDFKNMVADLLRLWAGRIPEKVIMFRDGVSEGQFMEVMEKEVSLLKDVIEEMMPDGSCKVTWVVVQKRHHTRFFPAEKVIGDAKGNVKAGVVVDHTITNPSLFNFFLCSHAGVQGTSKPAHYHVLCDENNFSADDLQNMVNRLCYTYVRCTSSVSIVPPAFYAHLAATHGRLIYDTLKNMELIPTPTADTSPEPISLSAEHPDIRDTMYFC